MNMTEYQSSDENIPDRILEPIKNGIKMHAILYQDKGDCVVVWDIKDIRYYHDALCYAFYSYDSEGKPRRYLTHSAHQSRPYSLEDGDSIDIGYEDINSYLYNK